MPHTLIVSNLAERDLREAFTWTQNHYPANREHFRDGVSETLELLRETPPAMGPVAPLSYPSMRAPALALQLLLSRRRSIPVH